ncbi:MAG: hypothetical protein RL094_268 [Candidatus Parcubacteria bacterium]|jgi:exonuclease III
MKVIFLNVYGGRFHENLLKFFAAHQDVDVICLQEVYHNAIEFDSMLLGRGVY